MKLLVSGVEGSPAAADVCSLSGVMEVSRSLQLQTESPPFQQDFTTVVAKLIVTEVVHTLDEMFPGSRLTGDVMSSAPVRTHADMLTFNVRHYKGNRSGLLGGLFL